MESRQARRAAERKARKQAGPPATEAQRHELRRALLAATPVIASLGKRDIPVDTLFGDMALAGWRWLGYPPLADPRSLTQAAKAGIDWLSGRELAAFAAVDALGSLEAWLAQLAPRFDQTVEQFAAAMIAGVERWAAPGLALPDDWALAERLVFAIVTERAPAWQQRCFPDLVIARGLP